MIFQFIAENKPKQLSFKEACRFFEVSPSGFFKNRKAENLTMKIREEETARSFHFHKGQYGYRKIASDLREKRGIACSVTQVRRLLKKQGLKAGKPKRFNPQTTQSGHGLPVAERVFKAGRTTVTALNQIWGSDITYLRAKGGDFLYLAVFMDFFSRRIVGWDLCHSLSSKVVLRAFERALKTRSVTEGLIVHSDRGVQYTAKEFRDKLKLLGFVQSMSRKGNCYDNSYCESWFSLLKRELGHRMYSGMNEARSEIFEWIEGWYNTHRLHSALGYRSPLEFEKIMLDKEEKTS